MSDNNNPIVTAANVSDIVNQALADHAAKGERDRLAAAAAADPDEAERQRLQALADQGKLGTHDLLKLGCLSTKDQSLRTANVVSTDNRAPADPAAAKRAELERLMETGHASATDLIALGCIQNAQDRSGRLVQGGSTAA